VCTSSDDNFQKRRCRNFIFTTGCNADKVCCGSTTRCNADKVCCGSTTRCNADKVCCGLMTDVIKSFCATSTHSHHTATANLLREIIMVRDNFLTLPGWFTCDDINDS